MLFLPKKNFRKQCVHAWGSYGTSYGMMLVQGCLILVCIFGDLYNSSGFPWRRKSRTKCVPRDCYTQAYYRRCVLACVPCPFLELCTFFVAGVDFRAGWSLERFFAWQRQTFDVFPKCVARVPVSLWGGWGWRVCSLDIAQPFATIRRRSYEVPVPVPMGSYKSGHFWKFQTLPNLVSCRTRDTLWRRNMLHNMTKVYKSCFARFSEDDLHFLWHSTHFGRAHLHFAWQAQHFRRVVFIACVLRIALSELCQVAMMHK